jgi:hypothetical protein
MKAITRRGFVGTLAAAALHGSPASQTTFDFHSGFWTNLHFVLYNQAAGRKDGRDPDLSALSTTEKATWNEALGYYGASVIDYQFGDFPMILISQALALAEGAARVEGKEPVYNVLEKAAPVYRAHWWTEHDRKNRAWIDQITPLIAAHEGALRPALARAYDAPWPEERIRAEVSYYLTATSGYTSLEPTLITVPSWSKRNTGAAGVETMFHEAGHGLVGHVEKEIDAAATRLGRRPVHKDLWHAVMFYTTGELVRRRLPEVEPYAIKYGLWEQGWPGVFEVMERRWKPFLDGHGNFHDAIESVVAES